MISIVESGMTFGPFKKECFFHIEKCRSYSEISEYVKMVEFVLCQQTKETHQVMLVEAKQSSPQPANEEDWNVYITELQEKFENGMNLFLSLFLKRYTDPDFPDSMQNINLSTNRFLIALVIKGHKPEWLAPLKDALNQKLRPLQKTLNLGPNPVLVLNDPLDIKIGMINDNGNPMHN